jgi:hypothetical protein
MWLQVYHLCLFAPLRRLLFSNYYGDKIATKSSRKYSRENPVLGIDGNVHMAFHKVMSFSIYGWNATSKQRDDLFATIANQYDIAKLLNEELVYSLLKTISWDSSAVMLSYGVDLQQAAFLGPTFVKGEGVGRVHSSVEEQIRCGHNASRNVLKMKPSGVLKTVFAEKAHNIRQSFVDFLPRDCQLKTSL